MIRIAFVVGDYPPEERKRRIDVALSYSSAEVEVGIVSVPATPYIHGLSPAEIQLAAPYFIESFRQAEREGYDAVVPLGFLDLGVDGGKSAVDIPVVGPMEASLHIASLVGDRFGLLVYNPHLIPLTRAIVRRYGMESWIAGIRTVGIDLPDLAANHDRVVENFVAEARKLINEDGADVIIPAGISQCPVHIKPDWLRQELGVPVVEGIGSPIRLAATLVSLGVKVSRVRWPKSPSFGA
ncbi:MAG: aspartate/glutamate racemase family protein [Chloroflexi bacterium]|nr:aspartate/glutamate racemase family protein [Chloroflexota bacterium]